VTTYYAGIHLELHNPNHSPYLIIWKLPDYPSLEEHLPVHQFWLFKLGACTRWTNRDKTGTATYQDGCISVTDNIQTNMSR